MGTKRSVVVGAEGGVTVADELGQNPDGSAALRSWTIDGGRGGAQIEKMAPTFSAPDDAGTPAAQKISAGDKSAALDAINQQLKQLKS